jgi:hypothetical protein
VRDPALTAHAVARVIVGDAGRLLQWLRADGERDRPVVIAKELAEHSAAAI